MRQRKDTETECHCGAYYNGSDHCPVCGCEQYESGDCGAENVANCRNCDATIRLSFDGAWEDESGACGCGEDEHTPYTAYQDTDDYYFDL